MEVTPHQLEGRNCSPDRRSPEEISGAPRASAAITRFRARAEAALAAIGGLPGAATLLHSAWTKAFGLHPDPKGAYDEAVRAVESAFCSAILPKANLTTLWSVTSALKDDPAKLQHVWPASDEEGRSAAELTRSLMELLQRQQGWRHGSEGSKDPNAPKSPTPEQAKAAVQLALLLISWRVSGSVIPAPKL